MKNVPFAVAAMAATLATGGAAHAATVFADFVQVVVPGQQQVTFLSFEGGPETFVGNTEKPFLFLAGTVFLTEPGTGDYSDALTIRRDIVNGGIDILFWSDPAAPLPGDIQARTMTLTETGGMQDVSKFFGPGISVVIGSDIDVPEPATWALMLIGIGGVGGVMRLRNKLGNAAA